MKRFFMIALMTVLFCFVAYSQTQNKDSRGMSKAEQQITALNRVG